jgi:excisionase family DNA binding protein
LASFAVVVREHGINHSGTSIDSALFPANVDLMVLSCMQTLKLPDSSRLLKVSELAAFLNLKPRTIYEMVAQKRIPYRKPPGSNILRFDLEEIIAWTKAGNK